MPTLSWRTQFVALAAIWGSSFLCIKVLGRHWPALDVALGRVLLGAVFLLVVLALRRERLPRGGVWKHLVIVGLLMNAIPFSLFAYGETKVSSILAGLWNATTPLMTLLVLLTVMRDEPLTGRRTLAILSGFAGVAVLLGPWQGLGGQQLIGHLACLGGAVCYGLGVPYTRRYLSGRPESGVALAGGQLLCAMVALAVVAPLAGAPTLGLGPGPLACLAVLGILGSGLAYVLTHAIVRAAGAATFSIVTYVIPIVSTALGVIVLGERLSWNEPVGAAIVLAGMWWSSRPARAVAR